MLGTVLDRLTGLLSKSFIVASFFPALIFCVLNGFILYWNCPWFRAVCERFFAVGPVQQTYLLVTALISVSVLAYFLSSINLLLRELLEGKHLPNWGWVRRMLPDYQRKTLFAMESRIEQIAKEIIDLKPQIKLWKQELIDARHAGKGNDPKSLEAAQAAVAALEEAQAAVAALEEKFASRAVVDQRDLQPAVAAVGSALRLNDANAVPAVNGLHVTLSKRLDEAVRRLRGEINRLSAERQFTFDSERVEATTLGNIARTAPSYAADRYGMNLDALWTRLQKVLQDNDKFYQSVLDAKTQLDFLVNFWWLTASTTLFWLPALALSSRTVFWFLGISVAGPLLALLWYRLAARAYGVFSDILRSAVDLYRFDLLKSLHLPLPQGLGDEKELWEQLNRLSWGDASAWLRYKHPDR